jgi:hypothetical protein
VVDDQQSSHEGREEGQAVELGTAESGPQAFMRTLKVPRNAKLGLAVGVVFTVAVFVVFVVIPGTYRSPLWYVALGFVLAVSVGGFVAFLLTMVRAYRLSRDL